MGGVETTLQAMLRHKAAEHGGDLASACTAISEAFLNVLQLAVGALAQCTEVNVPRSLAALKRALEPTGPQAHGPPAIQSRGARLTRPSVHAHLGATLHIPVRNAEAWLVARSDCVRVVAQARPG